MLTVDLFSVYLLPCVDVVVRFIEVDFTLGVPDYDRYIEEFVISRFYSRPVAGGGAGGGSSPPRNFQT